MDSHNGCGGDAGWLVMTTQITGDGLQCDWETFRELPVFLYSKLSTRVVWNDGTGEQIISLVW